MKCDRELLCLLVLLVHCRCLLDVALMYYDRVTKGRLAREAIVLSALEHTLLVAGFAYCPVHVRTVMVDFTSGGTDAMKFLDV